jgi:hypothetical protein
MNLPVGQEIPNTGGVYMKKLLFVVLALALIATGAFAADFGIGWIQSGYLQGPAFIWDPIPLVTVEAGFNVAHAGLNTPAITIKTKSWTDPNPEPDWTVNTVEMPKELGVSAAFGTVGVRGLFNLQRPNPNSKFYVGAGFNAVRLVFDVNYYDENGGPDDSLRVQGELGTWAFQGVALCGAEYRFKDVPNLGIRAEMGYALAFLGDIVGALNMVGDAEHHIKAELDIKPGTNWGYTYWTLGAVWHF